MEEEHFLIRLRRVFVEFNLFKTVSRDERSLRIQRWSTRLYIPLLFGAMCVLLVYTIIQVQARQIEVLNPSISTYMDLYAKYDNVKCPCTQISVLYERFLELSPLFHQVCSSDLISEEWIDFLFDKDTTTLRYPVDFRTTAFNQFQILRQLCQLSDIAINDGILTLNKSQLISGELLNEDLFIAQVKADILEFQTVTASDFARSLSFMRNFIAGNELLSAVETAYTLVVNLDDEDEIDGVTIYTNYFTQTDGSECSCDNVFNCYVPAGFYDVYTYFSRGDFDQTELSPQEFIDGWNIACWPLESLLISTLESFYNQTVLDHIITNINSSTPFTRFKPLNPLENSNFSVNSTLETLVENLFVENWLQKWNYSSYFSQCQPRYCQYTINQRPETLYIITSLLGLYGGLSVVLHLIIPHIVNLLFKKMERRPNLAIQQHSNINNRWFLRVLITNLWNTLLNLNFYRSPLRIENNDIKYQRWSTRVYIGSLLVALLILTLYSSVSAGTRIIQVDNPSLDLVMDLEKQSYSLSCPCQVLSINHEYLFELTATYHQICSSPFGTSEWIEYLNSISTHFGISYDATDFRVAGASAFQLLFLMCSLSQETVSNALFQFGKIQLVTSELLQIDLFISQMNATIDQFTQTLPNNLLRLLQLIRNVTHLNQFTSGGITNFDLEFYTDEQSGDQRVTLQMDGPRACGVPSALYKYDADENPVSIEYIIPNFYARCYPIESLLPSTMECFYDSSPCFDIMNNISEPTIYKNFTRLDSSKPNRFAVNSTIGALLEQLFVDSWPRKFNYSSYFDKCQPLYCSYTIIQRRSLIEIVTTITGLIGGLSTIFKFLSPYMVAVFLYLIDRYRHRHERADATVMQNNNGNLWTRIIATLKKIRDILFNLNIFEDVDNPSFDENELRIERYSTRLYIVLLLITIFILVSYTSLIYRNNEVQVSISSLDQFNRFQDTHRSMVVSCPCTQLLSIRSKFYQMEPTFHEVCSSDFVTNQWLIALFNKYRSLLPLPLNAFTFNGTAFAHFQSMSIICSLVKQAVLDGRDTFLRTSVLSSQMPNIDLFYLDTNSTLNDLKKSLANDFIHNLQMFRGLTQGNGLISVYATNGDLFLLSNLTKDPTIYMNFQSYGECDCGLTASCIQNSIPYVPGYVIGCLPLESYLRSTLECLYDQICVDQMSIYMNSSYFPKSLSHFNSRFAKNTTINDIVEEMLIESWFNNASYEKYFQECQPQSCSYTITERYNGIYVITTLLGLYGGITILLKLIVPRISGLLYKYINRGHRTNHQVMPLHMRY